MDLVILNTLYAMITVLQIYALFEFKLSSILRTALVFNIIVFFILILKN